VVQYERCRECLAARLEGEHCLAHLSESELDCVGQRLRSGEALDARGARITTERLRELLAQLRADGGPPRMPVARFDGAQFVGDSDLEEVRFLSVAHFDRAKFCGEAHFEGAEFSGDAHFDGTQFLREGDFRKARFTGEADFRRATFRGAGRFKEALFAGETRFDGARFAADSPKLRVDADFSRARFAGTHRLGALVTTGSLILDRAVFDEHVTILVRADRLLAADTRFRSGTDIRAQSATIEFDRAAFGATSSVSPATRHGAPHVLFSDVNTKTIPRLVSLRDAQIEDLAISGLDLRTCHFRGAEGLAGLRLEQVLLAEPPEHWTKSPRGPFRIRWTRRAAIAEEHQWRADKRFGWPSPDWPSARVPEPPPSTPHQIAAIYRSLRKGQEERKDEPGAADFYYGEMEMRRQSRYVADAALASTPPYEAPTVAAWMGYDNTRRTPLAERLVLLLYWLVSGYGLRASRALVSLAISIGIGAALLSLFGFDDHQRPEAGALLFAIESSVSLLREPNTEVLTDGGEVVAITLRLLGPLFFGLALLSLRGRIKR
jgi:uncharacterized protein YjbI with pentapeptide repeats